MAQSDVMCSFTRPKGTSQGEAVITHEVRITFRASGTHRSKNEKSSPNGLLSFLVAEVGFFIALPSRIVETGVKRSFTPVSPCFVGYRYAKIAHCAVFACSPTTSFGARGGNSKSAPHPKRKPTRLGWFPFWLRRWDLNLTTSGL